MVNVVTYEKNFHRGTDHGHRPTVSILEWLVRTLWMNNSGNTEKNFFNKFGKQGELNIITVHPTHQSNPREGTDQIRDW